MVEQALHVLTFHILWKSKDAPMSLPGQKLMPEEKQKVVRKEK
jgi:cohesin complex subunit SA-1/2